MNIDADEYYNRAVNNLNQGNLDQAILDFEHVKELRFVKCFLPVNIVVK